MATRKLKTAGSAGKKKVTAKPVIEAKVADKPAVVAKKAAVRSTHGLTASYSGQSQPVNKNRSRTLIDHGSFNSQPDMTLTPRTLTILEPLKAKYKGAAWARNDIGAGIIKYGIQKGHIEPVSGTGNSEADTYRFTKSGISA